MENCILFSYKNIEFNIKIRIPSYYMRLDITNTNILNKNSIILYGKLHVYCQLGFVKYQITCGLLTVKSSDFTVESMS
jgi:hypothetical protein